MSGKCKKKVYKKQIVETQGKVGERGRESEANETKLDKM